MTDIVPFKPKLRDVKDIVELFNIDGVQATCDDQQAQDVLNNWNDSSPDTFYEHVRSELMEGEIFNPVEDDV